MQYTVRTDVGVVRSENQDRAAVFHNDDFTFAILCDGMGGHQGGSHASSITIATFEKEFEKGFKEENVTEWFRNTVAKSKEAMIKFAGRDKALLDMGTTLTAALIAKDKVYIFNIGDSRTHAYNGLFHLITKDHNLRNHYIDKWGYSVEEAAKVIGAAALTSALGPTKQMFIDAFVVANDESLEYIVLTSDGIHDYISKPVFERIIADENRSLEEKGDELIATAIKGKSSDNLTCAIVKLR